MSSQGAAFSLSSGVRPLPLSHAQGFNWDSPKSGKKWYDQVKEVAQDIKAVGITDVWLPPPSKSVDKNGTLTPPSFFSGTHAISPGAEHRGRGLPRTLCHARAWCEMLSAK